MDELLYRFLLQSGFPRAAVVSDLDLLPLSSGGGEDADDPVRPSFAIVDPDTGNRLAVIDAVDAIDGDELRAAAGSLGRYARRFGGRSVQGFIVRVDYAGGTPEEQVQFYRIWPNEHLERVTAKAFPDLDSLRTWQLLAERRETSGPSTAARPTLDAATLAARAATFGETAERPVAGDGDGDDGARLPGGRGARVTGAWTWIPGLALVGLACADAIVESSAGEGLLSTVQTSLLIGAATLLLVAAITRHG